MLLFTVDFLGSFPFYHVSVPPSSRHTVIARGNGAGAMPSIAWEVGGVIMLNSSRRYTITSNLTADGSVFMLSSTITISDITDEDNGLSLMAMSSLGGVITINTTRGSLVVARKL